MLAAFNQLPSADDIRLMPKAELDALIAFHDISITELCQQLGYRRNEVHAVLASHTGARLDSLYPAIASIIASRCGTT